MAISFEKAVGLHENALKLRAQRAQIISSNLANADTPGYQARDINFHQALQARMAEKKEAGRMGTTHAAHMTQTYNGMKKVELFYRVPSQPSVDGNTVEEHVEHAEFMRNNLEFQSAFTLLNSRFKGLIAAIRGE